MGNCNKVCYRQRSSVSLDLSLIQDQWNILENDVGTSAFLNYLCEFLTKFDKQ